MNIETVQGPGVDSHVHLLLSRHLHLLHIRPVLLLLLGRHFLAAVFPLAAASGLAAARCCRRFRRRVKAAAAGVAARVGRIRPAVVPVTAAKVMCRSAALRPLPRLMPQRRRMLCRR